MPLPSLYQSSENAQAWSIVHATACGAGIGALAGLFKILGPLRASNAGISFADGAAQIVGAAVVFALLCGGAAALRNLVARRLVWRDGP